MCMCVCMCVYVYWWKNVWCALKKWLQGEYFSELEVTKKNLRALIHIFNLESLSSTIPWTPDSNFFRDFFYYSCLSIHVYILFLNHACFVFFVFQSTWFFFNWYILEEKPLFREKKFTLWWFSFLFSVSTGTLSIKTSVAVTVCSII